jgi:hypothetical protein
VAQRPSAALRPPAWNPPPSAALCARIALEKTPMQRFYPQYLVFLVAHLIFIGAALAIALLNN